MDWEALETKWEKRWLEKKVFEADPNNNAKVFVTFPYPYVNGPAHFGHAFTIARVDTFARFKRMQGFNVLFPQGFHATGEPIMGVAKRIKKGDQKQIQILMDAGVPKSEIENFKDAKYIANYWVKSIIKDFTRYGLSIDWRRKFVTTTLTPQYSRFIEWQYNTLRKKGYVVQGTHPVIWCPNCESPTGDHDRLEGEGATVVEFTILKFQSEFGYFAAATLRPETIFGVVNMWVHPDGTYVAADVDGERWIISKDAAEKLKLQKDVKIVQEFKGSDLTGKKCTNSVLNNEITIYPANFVDTKVATGVVMSVPSHAPYDWVGVLALQKQGIKLQPISLIETEDLGEHPGIDICEERGITEQDDPRLEEVTKMIYKKEYHKGVLKKNCGKYAGLKVSNCKDILIKDFKKQNIAGEMHECSDKVVCRCNTGCVIKILKNQWFLKFSDPTWKKKVKEALNNMTITPGTARAQFEYTVGWLKDKACARRSGLGTPLPWDPAWIVETLSDSTIYMAYYTISKYINELDIDAEKLTDAVFDYIFLGKGNVDKVAKESGLGKLVIQKMKDEFEYWYPVDFRASGKDLIPNHLTFYLFHHTAIWPEDKWPRIISPNGFLTVEGEKMSKSKGNFIVLKNGIKKYGADPLRLTLLYAAEGMNDPDFRERQAFSNRAKMEEIIKWAKQLRKIKEKEKSLVDKWLMSRIQLHIGLATKSYEGIRIRSAIQSSFYDMYNDLRYYLNRGGANKETIKEFLKTISLLIAPIIPHFAEEIWHEVGEEGFVSTAMWPAKNEKLIDRDVELGEVLVKQTLEDLNEIKKLVKTTPRNIFIYVAPVWKQKVVDVLVKNRERAKDQIMKQVLGEDEMRGYGKEIVALVTRLTEDRSKIPEKILGTQKELEVLRDATMIMKEELGAEKVEVVEAEKAMYDPRNKCKFAMPFKPAIYIE
jgi:leucyl-tRNA synthetase